MPIDPADLRRHYASLTDEALLEIERDELVDAAQHIYDDELAERGIVLEAPADSAPADAAPQEDWVLAASYLTAEEANLAHSMLEGADIPCRLAANNTSAWTGTGEIRLLVPEKMLIEAETILGAPISDEELAAQAEAEGPPEDA